MVFVAVVLVEAAFLERHQQEHVAVCHDESLIPDGGIEGQTEERRNILAHVMAPGLCR